jgi:hypothetical protein
VALEPPVSTEAKPPPEPIEDAQHRPGRNDFRCGDKASFEDKYFVTRVGQIVRINQRTTIDTEDGLSWRVPFPMWRHVLEI